MSPGPITFPEASASEPRLILPALSSAIAFELGSGIRSYFLATHPDVAAEKPGAGGIALQIKLFNGHLLFASAVGEGPIPGPSNWGWADAKFNTVKKMGDSSWTVKQQLAKSGKTPEAVGLPFPEYAVAGGGVPIWIKGNTAAPVGAIIVSGLPQQEDHQLIMNAVFGTMPHLVEPPSDPSYITYRQ